MALELFLWKEVPAEGELESKLIGLKQESDEYIMGLFTLATNIFNKLDPELEKEHHGKIACLIPYYGTGEKVHKVYLWSNGRDIINGLDKLKKLYPNIRPFVYPIGEENRRV